MIVHCTPYTVGILLACTCTERMQKYVRPYNNFFLNSDKVHAQSLVHWKKTSSSKLVVDILHGKRIILDLIIRWSFVITLKHQKTENEEISLFLCSIIWRIRSESLYLYRITNGTNYSRRKGVEKEVKNARNRGFSVSYSGSSALRLSFRCISSLVYSLSKWTRSSTTTSDIVR